MIWTRRTHVARRFQHNVFKMFARKQSFWQLLVVDSCIVPAAVPTAATTPEFIAHASSNIVAHTTCLIFVSCSATNTTAFITSGIAFNKRQISLSFPT